MLTSDGNHNYMPSSLALTKDAFQTTDHNESILNNVDQSAVPGIACSLRFELCSLKLNYTTQTT